MDGAAAEAELLWLETLQLVTARAAHELKGALNGVSVNLEVVRGRAAQASQPASSVERFAGSAAVQLDVVIEMNEALLALARRGRDPADVGTALRHLGALLVPGARAGGIAVTVEPSPEDLPEFVGVSSAVGRSLVARALIAVIDRGGGRVRIRGNDGGAVLELEAREGVLDLAPRAAAVAAAAGIEIRTEGSVLTLTFPAVTPDPVHAGASTHQTA